MAQHLKYENKIALCSPHSEPNHGTMLQAFALAKAIENLGFQAEYISYVPYIKKTLFQKAVYYLLHPRQLILKLSKHNRKKSIDDYSFFSTSVFAKTKYEFTNFYENLIPKTKIIYNPKTIKDIDGYSNFIVGSDQTWSPSRYKPGSIFFLDFVKDGVSKNSYAPSLGTTDVPDFFQDVLKQKLTDFNNISCREEMNSKLISKLINKEVTHVVDPTLLLTTKQWDTIARHVAIPDKYILCYILGEKSSISEFAENLGKKTGIPVYYIVTRPLYLQKKHTINDIGPAHFIWLIKNASYIITDSYHGTIFSILYNKKFYSFTKREENSSINDNDRIWELLQKLDLTDRFVNNGIPEELRKTNYQKVNKIIDERRVSSLLYLKRILEKNGSNKN